MIISEIRSGVYFPLFLLLSIILTHGTFSYRILHGCLTKPDMIAFGKDIDGPNTGSIEVDSLESCARACSQESACRTFFFKASPLICQLRTGTELQKRIGYTGGWCPRGVVFHPDVGNIKASVPLQCSAGSGKICQFPVKVRGQVHWNCLDRSGTPVCNTREDSAVQSFNDLSTFEECGTCDQVIGVVIIIILISIIFISVGPIQSMRVSCWLRKRTALQSSRMLSAKRSAGCCAI